MIARKSSSSARAIGRFLTPDPAGYTDSPNLYAYVLNDPINNVDPSGLMVGDESDPIVVFGEILRRGSASSGGNGGISIGSGSFFHFLDPFASNVGDGQAPPAMGREEQKPFYCSLPAFGLNGSLRAYAGLGGGIVADIAFDPGSGHLGVTFGVDVGVGLGGGVVTGFSPGTNLTVGRSVQNGFTASIGANANARLGPVAAGVSETLIGRNGPGFGGLSLGVRSLSLAATANANIGARIGYGRKIDSTSCVSPK